MKPTTWGARWLGALCGMALLSLLTPSWAEEPPPRPFGPDWAMFAGYDVFIRKGCGQCHAVRGVGGNVGPDLARVRTEAGYYELGAALWNHLPRMGARMRQEGRERPTLTGAEVSNLLAFLFTTQYADESGDPKSGERLFTAKGCAQCHGAGGQGGDSGPALTSLRRANSPVLVATAMWNHGPQMAEAMKARGIPRPTFKDRELVDVIAYIVQSGPRPEAGQTVQVVPGSPERGEKLFVDRQCAACHTIGGKGGTVGPMLGRAHHVSLTQFAGGMWNHGPVMWARMKERGIPVPQLAGQDTADIVAFLYTAHYFDRTTGSATRGRELVQSKGCLACHSVRGQGGSISADFATSKVVGSAASVIAAMWNHSSTMEATARKQDVALPSLTGTELADITRYLGSLGKAPGPAK